MDHLRNKQDAILKNVNDVGRFLLKPVVKLSDLEINKPYQYIKIKKIKTRFCDEAVVLELKKSMVYLPQRFSHLSFNELDHINAQKDNLRMVYGGPLEIEGLNPMSIVMFTPK